MAVLAAAALVVMGMILQLPVELPVVVLEVTLLQFKVLQELLVLVVVDF
jgi:hypothetical protein